MKLVAVTIASVICLASATASAQVYRWTDANGKVQYSERPMSQSAQTVQNRQSSGTSVCDAACQSRLQKDRFEARLEEELRNVPPGTCRASYNVLNKTSKRLAEESVQECKRNYAMSRIDPNHRASTRAQEGSRRQNQAVNQAVRDAREEQRHQETLRRQQQQHQETLRQQQQGPEKLRLRNSYTGAQTNCTRSYGIDNSYNCR